MKKALWGVGIVVLAAAMFGLGWLSHGGSSPAPAPSPSSSSAAVVSATPSYPAANTPPPTPQRPFVSQSDYEQWRTVRAAALQANPDLAAEYKQIIKALQDEQTGLDAAMIKADPKVAPIIAKLVALRQRNAGHAPASVAGPR